MTQNNVMNLKTAVQYVKGIGPKRAEALALENIVTVSDLLTHYPRRYLDRSQITPIHFAPLNQHVTIIGKITGGSIQRGRRSRFVLSVQDETGMLQCVWFQGINYIQNVFKTGQTAAFCGRLNFYRGLQLVHPEYDILNENGEDDALHALGIVPMYPSTEKLSRLHLDSRGFRKVFKNLFSCIDLTNADPLSNALAKDLDLMPWERAIREIHFPSNWKSYKKAEYRLKFDELFALQLALCKIRSTRKINSNSKIFDKTGGLADQYIHSLPFKLTKAQNKVIEEIKKDVTTPCAMNRLIQGDVGSGKTIVAVSAMLLAVENGYQAAVMAPTEILAEQHFLSIQKTGKLLNTGTGLLKGSMKECERKNILDSLKNGEINIIVGTHALIQEAVEFSSLGLIVIDEQHRFGVSQRAVLKQKGYDPHVLIMTATPIPRTLSMTLYGDLDVSVIDELPPGRKPIRTAWRKMDKRGAIYDFMRNELKKGRQGYIVYPLVEESEKMDLADATAGFEMLSEKIFPEFRLALLHGRMQSEEKKAVMHDFKAGKTDVLISTTVIEVGVDVPNASVMLIEHSERFGLPQLHQLRGRIGRGEHDSTCILISEDKITEEAKMRLQTMVKTTDGFEIAEADLNIRGPGELMGTRQHGRLPFKIANLVTDTAILQKARKTAFAFMNSDLCIDKKDYEILEDRLLSGFYQQAEWLAVG